ncbi:MAG: hypothetical protein WBN92_14125, partial [Terriglobia bacterium]
ALRASRRVQMYRVKEFQIILSLQGYMGFERDSVDSCKNGDRFRHLRWRWIGAHGGDSSKTAIAFPTLGSSPVVCISYARAVDIVIGHYVSRVHLNLA